MSKGCRVTQIGGDDPVYHTSLAKSVAKRFHSCAADVIGRWNEAGCGAGGSLKKRSVMKARC